MLRQACEKICPTLISLTILVDAVFAFSKLAHRNSLESRRDGSLGQAISFFDVIFLLVTYLNGYYVLFSFLPRP